VAAGGGAGGAVTAPTPRPVVAVQPAAALAARPRLFGALAAAFGLEVVGWEPGAVDYDALVVVGGVPAPAPAAGGATPTVAFADAGDGTVVRDDVRLRAAPALDRRLHGVWLRAAPVPPGLVPAGGEAVLADGSGGPVWTRRAGPAPLDRLRAALPELAPGEVLRDALRGDGALAVLALVELARALAPGGWTAPPLRAAILFDDPNLRRPTYGHLDFARLAAHADAHGYHAAVAVIPLDARHADPEAVAPFRRRPDRLSLAVHGNDHTREELLRAGDAAGALALAAQALRRVARLEEATGLRVDRVMVPPHGRCSRAVVRALGTLGWDGVCAIHPRPWTERPDPEEPLAGWGPAELLDGGTVLPRFPLDCAATEIALRAYLDQPLILYGHHGDVAGGLEPLAAAAARVNALGDVRWGSLGELARAGWARRTAGGTAAIRPWGSRLRIPRPPGVEEVAVAAPAAGADAGVRGWSLAGEGPPRAFGSRAPFGAGPHVDVRLRPLVERDVAGIADPPRRPWPLVRRRVTETRDRLAARPRRRRPEAAR